MAVEGATQALVAAFFFGIVLNAASATLVLYLRGYALSTTFRDSQRLVLVLFLLSSALWAQTDFITILLDITESSTPCQVGVIFSTVFDQLARFSIEQFLLWAMAARDGTKLSMTQLISQAVVLIRFLAGAVFIGFTRPQTDNFCVAATSALPVGIMVPALDAAIIALLVIRAYSAGGIAKRNNGGNGIEADRARAVMSVLLGFAFWTATSVPLLLGIETIALAVRTALPAGGLLVLLVFVAGGSGSLLTSRTAASRPPEAPSPRRINITRDVTTSASDYPPSRYEDLKEAAIRSSTTFVNPREAPSVKDETTTPFPLWTGTTVPGEPIPPMPASIAPVSGFTRNLDKSAWQQKNLRDFGKGVKPSISHPILQADAEKNPLNKIAVMDLQQAAVADRERRARMQADMDMGVRPGMDMTPDEGLKRSVSVKRKDVASVSSRQSTFPGNLQPGGVAVALTTSAQLSPGGEETRRRSARQSPREPLPEQPPSPVQVTEPAQSQLDPSLMVLPQSNDSQQALTRPDIRPSRTLPPSPEKPPPEPTKTPLQRRPPIGLPSNPRARGLKVEPESGPRQKTILFLNNIEYKDPVAVEAIIRGANDKIAKTAPALETPGSSLSIVNRPRPIPRKRPGSTAQPSPSAAHRRSRSGGSLIGRKPLLAADPGSPTQLPPLPPPPGGAITPGRPHPNDTKSMTFEEKMTLLFPSPSTANTVKRGPSVPEVPPIPVSYFDVASSPSELDPRRRSNRTTKTTVRTESVLEVDEIPRRSGKPVINTADEADSSWVRGFVPGNDYGKPNSRQSSRKRGSSPVIPAVSLRASAWTETTYDRTEDDMGTNWSVMQSPELAVGVRVVQNVGLPSSIQMPVRRTVGRSSDSVSSAGNSYSVSLPIMLDQSTLDVQDRRLPEDEVMASPRRTTPSQWHRRVGDECPTFSDRKEKTRSRKMSPPPPLSLHTASTKRAIVVQAEPSPLESPRQALEQIQRQLKKLEEPGPNSPQSASKRLALLENLEREMGLQVEHWQEIRRDVDRASMSSIQTVSPPLGRSSRRESLASSVARESLAQSSIGAERRASRAALMQGNGNAKITDVPARNSGSTPLNKWQKRLTEAHMDYMDAQLLRTSTATFLQLSRSQLASPTPPDSDHSDHSDGELPPVPSLPHKFEIKKPSGVHPKLWTPAPKESTGPAGLLWTPVVKPAAEVEVQLPGLFVRPAKRHDLAPLRIESKQLWHKPYNTVSRSASGLWRPVWASAAPPAEPIRAPSQSSSQSQKAPRPLTQRPPRRNKRMTLLPDILESPEPLPNKRDTLGIFQFPWGERSDTASIRPRSGMFMAMPGTMTSGGPPVGGAMGARSRQPDATEYTSSFFDDYDDDDDDDFAGMDSDEDGSDDGFDETTLWEIASLLKTDAVPSKNSLLPPASGSVVQDYMEELPSDDEGASSREVSILIGLDEPREFLFDQQRDSATIESSTLAMLEEAYGSKTPAAKPAAGAGLPANPKAFLMPQASHVSRPADAEATAPATPTGVSELSQVSHHTADAQKAEIDSRQGPAKLWQPPSQADTPQRGGLFLPGSSQSTHRSTSEEPAAKYMSWKPRAAELKPLDKLTSTKLWARKDTRRQHERNWILGKPQATQLGSKIPADRHQRPEASSEDWKAALDEAIAASYPHTNKLKRILAGPSEWRAALQEAISLSGRALSSPRAAFDPAVRHPVFAARSLATRSEYFHPAATGYTHDVAAVHPVFFGSQAITCPEEAVHPAISALAAEQLRGQRSKHVRDSHSGDPDHSDSSRTARGGEPPALEQQGVDTWLPPPMAAALPVFGRDSIQAQIEALEQERLFVERAAEEEYRRRTFMGWEGEATYMTQPASPLPPPPPPSPPPSSSPSSSPVPALAPQESSSISPAAAATTTTSPLWARPLSAPTPQPLPAGLWTPSGTSLPAPAPAPTLAGVTAEDAPAAVQRARRRKTAAGSDPPGEFGFGAGDRGLGQGQGLWRRRSLGWGQDLDRWGGRDWLKSGSANGGETRVVVLRY